MKKQVEVIQQLLDLSANDRQALEHISTLCIRASECMGLGVSISDMPGSGFFLEARKNIEAADSALMCMRSSSRESLNIIVTALVKLSLNMINDVEYIDNDNICSNSYIRVLHNLIVAYFKDNDIDLCFEIISNIQNSDVVNVDELNAYAVLGITMFNEVCALRSKDILPRRDSSSTYKLFVDWSPKDGSEYKNTIYAISGLIDCLMQGYHTYIKE